MTKIKKKNFFYKKETKPIEQDPPFQKWQIVNYQEEKLFQNSCNNLNLDQEIAPLIFTEKLAKALEMKSVFSPPPYFNKLVEIGVPYYYKSIILIDYFCDLFCFLKIKEKNLKYIGLNEYLPTHYPRNEWRKTKIDRKWLKKTPDTTDFMVQEDKGSHIFFMISQSFLKDRKYDSDVMIDESKDVEKEINKHIRMAVPIYEDEVEIENISDDD